MIGHIYAYSDSACAGIIRDTSGHTYIFNLKEWAGKRPPSNDMRVTFIAQSGQALSVTEDVK